MAVQIKRYAVTTWGNKNTGDMYYGISVLVAGPGGRWMNCCEGARPILLPSRKAAKDCIAKMKAERDKDGFKKVA